MRVIRGRRREVAADRAVTGRLADRAAAGERVVRVWRPPRQVAFGRRDARADGYERARAVARDHGFPPVERETGGRAVAYTGTTVAFVRAEPIADFREGLADRYDRAVADLRRALAALGVDAREGEPADSFCPGSHSLRAEGKLAGIAQRVRGDAAVVGGVVVVRDHARIAAVLAPVYDALSVPFDPATVDSVAGAGGPDDPDAVRDAVEDALVGDADPTVERVD